MFYSPVTFSCLFVQELPEQWNNVKKQSVLVKQAVAPLQTTEVSRIRKKLIKFDVKQHTFRETFRKTAPFNFDAENIYKRIDMVIMESVCKQDTSL